LSREKRMKRLVGGKSGAGPEVNAVVGVLRKIVCALLASWMERVSIQRVTQFNRRGDRTIWNLPVLRYPLHHLIVCQYQTRYIPGTGATQYIPDNTKSAHRLLVLQSNTPSGAEANDMSQRLRICY